MLVSELIKILQDGLEANGDMPVMVVLDDRHLVVEAEIADNPFVPGERLAVISGPS